MRQKFLIGVALFLLLQGCGLVYKIDVQQGNVVTKEMVGKLKYGMSGDKVLYIMGNPLLADIFHRKPPRQRWDYYYSRQERDEVTERRLVTLFLENNRLVSVVGADALDKETLPEKTAPAEPLL